MGPKKTNELLELLELGFLCREHIRTVYNSFHQQVDVFKDASLERSISTCNKKKFINHSFGWTVFLPQRWFGPSSHVTTTVIETNTERVVAIAHDHQKIGNEKQKGALIKYTTPISLEKAAQKLDNISHIITDCSSSMPKIIGDVLRKVGKHRKVIHAKDI
jgi:hypothetical protein